MQPKTTDEIKQLIAQLNLLGDSSADLTYISEVYEFLPEETQLQISQDLVDEIGELQVVK